MKTATLIIDGDRIATRDHFEVRNPANGALVGKAPAATEDQLELAVEAANRAFETWSQTSDAERRDACLAIADIAHANAEELAQLITAEQGKPLNGQGSRMEMGGVEAWARNTAELTLPIEVLQDNNQGRIELHRKPVGVVGSITPWNWPVMIASWHFLPAIRAGNTVICKPSPMTPLSTLRLIELINTVLPKGVLNGISGCDWLGAAMTSHPGIAKIAFTGSTDTGRKVMQTGAATLKHLTLELGGNDAAIILPDADPAAIAEDVFWRAFINNGQTCGAIKRLYVHDDIYEPMCEALVAYARTVTMGEGSNESTQLGPLQNKAQFEIVSAFVEEAKQSGARVLMGGKPWDSAGYFYPITLVADIAHGTRLVDREQFGPALPIIRYHTIEEAIDMANSTPYGLCGSVWGRDREAAKALAQRLRAGSVWVNRHGNIQPGIPFGGVKQSGIGTGFGVDGLKEFTEIQVVYA